MPPPMIRVLDLLHELGDVQLIGDLGARRMAVPKGPDGMVDCVARVRVSFSSEFVLAAVSLM